MSIAFTQLARLVSHEPEIADVIRTFRVDLFLGGVVDVDVDADGRRKDVAAGNRPRDVGQRHQQVDHR